ncbi:MAG TPA: hypothetical protein VI893_08845 [Thermoplasmata archaeon]|nr:hypothetical protein [Thermoplasmata archaeon]
MKLTQRERVILHLWDFTRERDRYSPPPEVTQSGIANATGTDRPFVSQVMKLLIKQGAVDTRQARPEGNRVLSKCYFLTPKGEAEARRLDSLLKDIILGESDALKTRESLVKSGLRRGLATIRAIEGGVPAGKTGSNPAGVPGTSNSPPSTAGFSLFGRAAELTRARDAIRAGRSLLLLGIGGIGKTALARKAVSGCEHLWIDWGSVGSAATVATLLARHLLRVEGKSLPEDPARLAQELAKGAPECILVVDGHSGDLALDRLLAPLAAAGRLVLTSRQRPTSPAFARAPGEDSVGAGMDEILLAPLDDSAASDLLASVGVVEGRRTALVSASGGLPLALQVAARFGAKEAKQETMQMIYRAISGSLDPHEVDALRRLSNVDGTFDPDLAVKSALLTYYELSSLKDKALLSADPAVPGSLRIHDVIRDLFRSPDGAEAAAKYHRSVGTPLSLLKAARASADGTGEVLFDLIRRDLGRIADHGLASEMIRLLNNVEDRWVGETSGAGRIAALRLAVAQLEIPRGGDPLAAIERVDPAALAPYLRPDFHRTLGIALYLNGKLPEAETELLDAMERARNLKDDEARGRAAISLIHFYAQAKRPGKLFAVFAEAEPVLTRLGDWYLMRALHNFAIYLVEAGLLDKAEAVIARAQDAGERIGDPDYLATVQNLHTHVLVARGALDEAEACAADMEVAMLEAGYPLGVAYSLEAHGIIAARRGQVERAERRFQESLDALGNGYPGETADVLATATLEMANAAGRSDGESRARALAAAGRLRDRFLEVSRKADARMPEVAGALERAGLSKYASAAASPKVF